MLDLARIFNSRIILLEHAAPARHSDGTIKHRRGREHMLVKSYFLTAGRNLVVLAVARGGHAGGHSLLSKSWRPDCRTNR